jgi:hypothetical protein
MEEAFQAKMSGLQTGSVAGVEHAMVAAQW